MLTYRRCTSTPTVVCLGVAAVTRRWRTQYQISYDVNILHIQLLHHVDGCVDSKMGF